jgi:membrane protein DedA with SNARE-associated domain
MDARARLQFRACVVFAVIGAALAVLTLVWPDWIEVVTGFSPDHGDGSEEGVITVVFAGVAVLAGVLARVRWRRARPTVGGGTE